MLGFKKNEFRGWYLVVIAMLVLAGAAMCGTLTGCANSQSAAVSSGGASSGTGTTPASTTSTSSTPTVQQIVDDADAWLGPLETIAGGLCAAGVMGSTDCADASLAAETANLAVAAFSSTPTAQNQTALSTAMKPVYAIAIKANTTAASTAAAATTATPSPGAAAPAPTSAPTVVPTPTTKGQ
jgi:hypothetical protein